MAATWFKFLQDKIQLRNKNTELLMRVIVDQTLFGPTILCVFLSSMSLMEGSSPTEKLRRTYTEALVKGWTVWPWVQLANFKLVPLEHRVMVVNIFSIGKEKCLQRL